MDDAAKLVCIKILTNLTKYSENIFHLVFRVDRLLDALAEATTSEYESQRKLAWLAIQNVSGNEACLKVLGSTSGLLESISTVCQRYQGETKEIQIACMATLRNLSRRQENVQRVLNSSSCMSMLLSLVRTKEQCEYKQELRNLACEILQDLSDASRTKELRSV